MTYGTINIISYIYGYTSKSFREFYSDFYNFREYSNNYIITNDYIVFDNIKPNINIKTDKYLTLRDFYKESKREKRLDNLICLFFYKFKTITKITKIKDNKIINIYNPYKELSRLITYPEDNDFTHLLTITYSHTLRNSIFEIMEDNEHFRKKVNKGIHRIRNYVYKKLKDQIKRKITDKGILNEKVKGLKKVVFKYFKVYELHKSNHLHAHILIKLPDFITKLDFHEIISKLSKWFDTTEQGIDLKRLLKSKGRNVKRYVLKYMFKQYKNDNVFYVENEKKEKIYLINKNSIIRNDIPRIISRSRNVKTKRFKPFFAIEKIELESKEKEIREINRFELEILQKNYEDFKEILKDFKTTKEKKLKLEIEKAEKRTEKLGRLKEFLNGQYYSIRDILKILDDFKDDEIIQERFYTEYQQALIKFLKLLDELEEQEEIEVIDF